MKNLIIPMVLCAIVPTESICAQGPGPESSPIPDVSVVPALPGRTYREPVQVLSMPGVDDGVVVVERRGRVLLSKFSRGSDDELLLDLRGRLTARTSEEGLLSLAFDPKWPARKSAYVYRSLASPRRTVLSRFTWDESSGAFNPDQEEVILEIPQPWGNHNGGTVLFGPDGMLYLSIGDGGSANDPQGAGQRMDTLLGKIIRIDVSSTQNGQAYRVPEDNPFVSIEGARPEIWASGLRNVWRMSFDPKTGHLWAGDVGQNAWEEIDIITRGGNYGWNIREGLHPFKDDPTGETSTLIDPVIEYGRDLGGSVTGGNVYRGSSDPRLDGIYFYGDYMSGRIWGAQRHQDGSVTTRELTGSRRYFPSSFGVAPDGTILMCAFSGPYQRSGEIVRIKSK